MLRNKIKNSSLCCYKNEFIQKPRAAQANAGVTESVYNLFQVAKVLKI